MAYLRRFPPEPPWLALWHKFRPAPPPPPPRPFTPPPWFEPPAAELGVAVPERKVLVQNPDLAVALIDCVAYSTGFKFSIVLRTMADIDGRALGFPGPPFSEAPADEQFQFGVRFADGRETKSELGWHHPGFREYFEAVREGREPAIPPEPVLSPRGGGGGGRRWDFNYWVWPLPPEGPITISCEWPKQWDGVVTVDVDGTAIREAGERSEKLW